MALIEGLEGSGKPLLHTSGSSVIVDNARGDYASNQIFEDESPFNLTKNLARGLAPEVRVNAVAPGVVDSEWTRDWPKEAKQGAADRAVLKRICTPQDIADVIVFLCVGTSMITGQTIVVDGGALLS
jgi:NADP-dependent 3-hydroxy acid dehydrogenase YdfG